MPRLAPTRHAFFLRDPALLAERPVVADAGEAEQLAKVPDWVNVLPAPDAEGKIFSRDKRVLNIDSLEKLAARSNKALKKQKGGGPVDKDHELYGGFFQLGGGPAIGWAEEFEARPSGLFARVDWLPEAKELISTRKYRYTSAVVFGEHEYEYADDDDWFPTSVQIFPDIVEGFAITNLPALQVTSMFSLQGDPLRDEALRGLLRKLGVGDDAGADDIRAAYKRLAARKVFSIGASGSDAGDADAEPERNVEKPVQPQPVDGTPPLKKDAEEDGETAGETNTGGAPPPASSPPAEAGVHAELAAARKQIAELEAAAGVAYVDALLAAGKITPAMRPAALEQASTAAGLAQLRALYKHAPAIVPTAAPTPAPTTFTREAPHGLDPLAHQLALEGVPAHEIARRLAQRGKENT